MALLPGAAVKTDSLFYRIFVTAPALFFELVGQPLIPGYQFQSIEVKQTAFRIDGVFLPPAEAPELPVYFVEVQFQHDPQLYHRLFAEIFLFLQQNPALVHWQAVMLFGRRSFAPPETPTYQVLLNSGQVQQIYLDQLVQEESDSVSVQLLRLITAPNHQTPAQAQRLLRQVEQQQPTALPKSVIMELIETTLVYKFPHLSREEIAKMLGLAESVKQTRVYQEGLEEGSQLEARSLVLRLLTRKIGPIPPEVQSQVENLALPQLEALGEALLDFASLADLTAWLVEHP